MQIVTIPVDKAEREVLFPPGSFLRLVLGYNGAFATGVRIQFDHWPLPLELHVGDRMPIPPSDAGRLKAKVSLLGLEDQNDASATDKAPIAMFVISEDRFGADDWSVPIPHAIRRTLQDQHNLDTITPAEQPDGYRVLSIPAVGMGHAIVRYSDATSSDDTGQFVIVAYEIVGRGIPARILGGMLVGPTPTQKHANSDALGFTLVAPLSGSAREVAIAAFNLDGQLDVITLGLQKIEVIVGPGEAPTQHRTGYYGGAELDAAALVLALPNPSGRPGCDIQIRNDDATNAVDYVVKGLRLSGPASTPANFRGGNFGTGHHIKTLTSGQVLANADAVVNVSQYADCYLVTLQADTADVEKIQVSAVCEVP